MIGHRSTPMGYSVHWTLSTHMHSSMLGLVYIKYQCSFLKIGSSANFNPVYIQYRQSRHTHDSVVQAMMNSNVFFLIEGVLTGPTSSVLMSGLAP